MAQLDVQGSKSSAVVPPGQALPSFFSQKKPMNSPQPEPSTAKAEGAYKTISEVSEELDVPTHVLRFWESRFPQVKPQRMRGSRRYYRPDDVETLKKIKTLLYSQGYTIKGAKKHVKDKAHEIHSAPAEQMAAPVAKQTAPVAKTPAAPAQPIKAKAPSAEVTKLLTELKDLRQKLLSFH